MIAVQVEVDDVQERAVRRGLQCCGKHAERDTADDAARDRGVLQDIAVGLTVRERDVEEPTVGRRGQAVRPVDVRRHDPGIDFGLDAGHTISEPDERQLVSGFGGDGGGMVLFEGVPEDLVKVKESHTGRFLKRELNG